MSEGDNDDCIVIRCGGCHRVIYAAVNDKRVLDNAQLKDIGAMVQRGHSSFHMTAAAVRKAAFGCKCEEAK